MARLPPPPAEQIQLQSLAEVARGGMGSVELARAVDGRLAGQILAVKRLHANIAEDPEFVAMFLDEACITAALKHPNVAQVIAWGNDSIGTFLAIELVQGVSLSRLLKEANQNKEPFAERTVAYLCSQICAGLTAAHGLTAPDGTPLGVVHRDLTPANVLVSFDGEVKIIDFGIAKAEERITHTRTGQLKGKPSYMAPEQQRGGLVDHRVDLFAFGVTMFELLAGRRPWMSKGAFDVMMEIANDPHPDLGELRKGLNPEFVEIAHKCLEKKAESRFNNAGEIKARLDAWLAAKGFSADDQQSLAQFVARNSQPQIKWWAEALRGEHAKKKAQTFKELEEKIDAEREKKAKAERAAAAPQRPAAGSGTRPMGTPNTSPASSPPSVNRPKAQGTVPMAAFGPPSSGPLSGPLSSGPMSPPAPSSGQLYAAPPSSGQLYAAPPPRDPLGGTEFLAQVPIPASQAAPLPRVPDPLGGTEFLAQVPIPASQAAPLPRVPDPLGGTEFLAQVPIPASQAAPSPRVSDPLGGTEFIVASPFPGGVPPSMSPVSQRYSQPGSQPVSQQPETVPMTPFGMPSEPPPAPPAPEGALAAYDPLKATAPSMQAPSAPKKRSKLGLVLVLVAIPLIGAGVSAWVFRDTILKYVGGKEAPRSAPASAPYKKPR